MSWIVGTAGHIDHGKTALVHALTGIDTDRLPIEKKRGITTELGFAHMDVAGARVAVIDVPGHERFVKSMVAGAGGIDLVLLVIAADEGVMPQTREHLDICELLGVRAGIVVLTKSDLGDAEWLELVESEVKVALEKSFLANAPVVRVSAKTGAGLDTLKSTLAAALRRLPPRASGGVFRLPIDRVFTIKGFGTVVTGTVSGGRLQAGDELVVLPRGLETRARGIEIHGAAAPDATAGQRAAFNLPGLAVEDLARGDVLVLPGQVAPSHILDVRFRVLAAARTPLPARSRVLVHHGTTQVSATLHLADAPLAPGATGLGQLRIDRETPLAALPGDRFIVRGFVPLADHGTTLGGGEILRAHAARLRKHAAPAAALATASLAERVGFEVRAAQAAGLTAAAIGQRVGVPAADLPLDDLALAGEVIAAGDTWIHAATLADLEARALTVLDAAPERTIGREELRSRLPAVLPPRAFDVVLDGLVRRGAAARDADLVRREKRIAAPALSPLEAAIVDAYRSWKLEPPRPKDVAAALGRPAPAVDTALVHLLAGKQLVKVKPDLYVDAATIADLRERLLAHLSAHGQITPQEWKDLTGTSRKYSIPLAEYFDAEKVTLRIGDLRRKR